MSEPCTYTRWLLRHPDLGMPEEKVPAIHLSYGGWRAAWECVLDKFYCGAFDLIFVPYFHIMMIIFSHK